MNTPRLLKKASDDWKQSVGILADALTRNTYWRQRDALWHVDSVVRKLQDIHRRPRSILNGCLPRGEAVCFLGTDRLAVRPNGELSVCPKLFGLDVSELNLGDVESGLDVDRILSLRESSFAVFAERCRSCWAVRLCNTCLLALRTLCGSPAEIDAECDRMRKEFERMLILYVRVSKVNAVAFDQI